MKNIILGIVLSFGLVSPAIAGHIAVEDNGVNHWSSNMINGDEFTDEDIIVLDKLLLYREIYVEQDLDFLVELVDAEIETLVNQRRLW